jgi:sporulation protein YlmC with PRC-barrel domain
MKTTLAMALMGALIALPVAAQTSRPVDQSPAPRATQQTSEAKAPALFEMKPGEWRATKLTGLNVYNPDNQKIGDISELIIDRNGKVDAVVIGVGGFLGMGEHQAAVPFEKVQWIDQPMAARTATTTTTGTTTGSGTSTVPATGTSNEPAATTNVPATTTTTVDRQTGSAVTTTTEHPAGTTAVRTDSSSARDAVHEAYRGYPDHAVVAMTKDQLKALPEVRYAR